MTCLHIDSREDKVIPFFEDSHTIVGNMKKGDYAIINGEIVLHVFERKSMSDLCYSIKNRSLHLDTMIELKKEGCKVAYIIETKRVFYDDDTDVHGIPYYKIRACLESFYITHDIPIIYTSSAAQTAKTLERYLARYKKNEEKHPSGQTHIGGTLVSLNTKPVVSMEERVKRVWISIPGLGENIATELMVHFSLIELAKVPIEKINNIKVNGRKIGTRIDASLGHYQKKNNNEIHQKMLSSINGVSEVTANRILAHLKFHKMTANTLSEIMINGRRLGKVGQRIMDYLNYKKIYKEHKIREEDKIDASIDK